MLEASLNSLNLKVASSSETVACNGSLEHMASTGGTCTSFLDMLNFLIESNHNSDANDICQSISNNEDFFDSKEKAQKLILSQVSEIEFETLSFLPKTEVSGANFLNGFSIDPDYRRFFSLPEPILGNLPKHDIKELDLSSRDIQNETSSQYSLNEALSNFRVDPEQGALVFPGLLNSTQIAAANYFFTQAPNASKPCEAPELEVGKLENLYTLNLDLGIESASFIQYRVATYHNITAKIEDQISSISEHKEAVVNQVKVKITNFVKRS